MTHPSVVSFRRDATVISLVGFAHSVSHFFQLILVPIFPWLKDAFHLSYQELGLLMTMFFIVSALGQALAGFAVDKIGARTVLFSGLACLGISALMLSMAASYSMLMAGAMLAGLGNSVFHPADFTILNHRISITRLGHAFSVHGISGSLGWAIAPLFMTAIATLAGWRIALVAAATLPFVVLIFLMPYRDLLDSGHVESSRDVHDAEPAGTTAFDFLRASSVWMCFVFFLVTSLALGGIHTFSSISLRAIYGMSLGLATMGYSVFMFASAVGMVWGGFLAAKASRHDYTIVWTFTAAGLIALAISAGVASALTAIVLMGLMGFCTGVAGPSRDLLIRAAAPKNATGRVYGVVYSALDIGFAFAALVFGRLMDAQHPAWVFILIGVFQILALFTAVGVGSSTVEKTNAAMT